MPKGQTFSHDLRIRMIYYKQRYNQSFKDMNKKFMISARSLRRYQQYWAIRGTTKSLAQTIGRRERVKSYTGSDLRALVHLFGTVKGLNMENVSYLLFIETGKVFMGWTIQRMIKAIYHSYKRVTIRAYEADPVLVCLHQLTLTGVPLDRLKFADEVHISTKNGALQYAYAPIGEQAVVDDVFVRRERATIIGVVTAYGMLAYAIKYGSVTSEAFKFFIYFYVLHGLEEGDYLILDNASIHKDHILLEVLAYLGIIVHWLPPYSPWLNPIELVWNGMKSKMRSSELRPITRTNPILAAQMALSEYYDKDLSSLYRQCGYH